MLWFMETNACSSCKYKGVEKLLNTDLLFALLEALNLMVSLIGSSWNKDPPNPD